MPINDELKNRLDGLVHAKPVVLFMKGSRHFPQCGFSSQVVQILNQLVPSYETVNVLSDPAIRDGIKEYSSWPTIPQLYVKGQFVGGCDIVKEMFASGELQKLLGATPTGAPAKDSAPATPPRIAMSDRAARAFKDAEGDANGDKLRLEINAQFQNELFFAPKAPGDVEVVVNGVTLMLDPASALRANGLSIDFVDQPGGGGFKIENPNEPPRVKPLDVRELKRILDAGETVELFDVRPETERARAKIDRAHAMDDAGQRRLASLAKGAKVVFHCHHGMRSRAAAEEAIRAGYTNVYNLEGGIDAWSSIDPSVPRY